MRPVLPFAVLPLLLLLSACSSKEPSVAGKYDCKGLPGLSTLTLDADGSAKQEGYISDNPMSGTGSYKFADGKVAVIISSRVLDGSQSGGAPDPERWVFDLQSNGDLQSPQATCKKV